MHHRPAEFAVHVQQRLAAQPLEQRVAVVGEQHRLQVRVDLALLVRLAFGDGEQRQVVVAEGDHAIAAQRMHQPQRFQRFAAAVDQVAAEPQPVARGIETDRVEQAPGRIEAALQVANGPGRHQCSVRGTARVKAGIGASNSVPSSPLMR